MRPRLEPASRPLPIVVLRGQNGSDRQARRAENSALLVEHVQQVGQLFFLRPRKLPILRHAKSVTALFRHIDPISHIAGVLDNRGFVEYVVLKGIVTAIAVAIQKRQQLPVRLALDVPLGAGCGIGNSAIDHGQMPVGGFVQMEPIFDRPRLNRGELPATGIDGRVLCRDLAIQLSNGVERGLRLPGLPGIKQRAPFALADIGEIVIGLNAILIVVGIEEIQLAAVLLLDGIARSRPARSSV